MTDFFTAAWYALPILTAVAALMAVAWLAEIVLTAKHDREAAEDLEDAQFNAGVPAEQVVLNVTVNETTWLFTDPSFIDSVGKHKKHPEPSSFRESETYNRVADILARSEAQRANWDRIWDYMNKGGAA